MPPELITALIGVASGAVGLELVKRLLPIKDATPDTVAQRQEWRLEVARLQARIEDLEAQVARVQAENTILREQYAHYLGEVAAIRSMWRGGRDVAR